MKISNHSIKPLYEIITGDTKRSFNRSGSELAGFFSKYGFKDMDVRDFPSRAKYAKQRIEDLNGTAVLEKVILDIVDPRHYYDSEYNVEEIVNFLNQYLVHDGYKLLKEDHEYKIEYLNSNRSNVTKNIIFAAFGAKPELVLVDTILYEIEIAKNKENCLIYDQPISNEGLTWNVLVDWWAKKVEYNGDKDGAFLRRLYKSLDSEPEKIFFRTYYSLYNPKDLLNIPALIPQVYLHYDPKTLKELKGEKRLPRQRMDFLLLLPRGVRVVIEIDGKQHYSDEGNKASPSKYAEMVREDRKLKLNGYEVYRFGGFEFQDKGKAGKIIKEFFEELFEKHKIVIER